MSLSNNRKVLFVHDGPIYKNSEDEYFGVHYNDKLIERYQKLGTKITFLMRVSPFKMDDKQSFSRITKTDFSVIEIPNFKSIKLYLKNYLRAKRIIYNAVYESDIIVIRSPSAAGTLAIKAARKYNKPHLVEFVACTLDAYRYYDWQGKVIAPFKYFLQKRIIKNVPFVVYVTKEFLQKRYPTKGKSINCSDVELTVFDNDSMGKRLIKIKSANNILTIGTVGTLDVKYKGQADVIKALALLKKDNIIFNYKIVGQGSDLQLRKLINNFKLEEQVEIVGAIPHNQINDFYSNLDIYIHPSRTEGLPRAIIEAMSTGCPVIASTAGGIPELINKENLFKPGNVKEIIQLLKKVNKEWMLKEAERNFGKAKEYKFEVLERKRGEFYELFLTDAKYYN